MSEHQEDVEAEGGETSETPAPGGPTSAPLAPVVAPARPRKKKKKKVDAPTEFQDPKIARRRMLLIAVVCFVVGILGVDRFPTLRYGSYDLMLQLADWSRGVGLMSPRRPPRQVAVIGIDEESVERYGRWPWSRTTVAELIEGLNDLGARTVAVDVLLAEPVDDPLERARELLALADSWVDREGARAILRDLRDVRARLDALPREVREGPVGDELRRLLRPQAEDQVLAERLRAAGNVVLGTTLEFEAGGDTRTNWLSPGPNVPIPRNARELVLRGVEALEPESLDQAWEGGMFPTFFFEDARALPVIEVEGINGLSLEDFERERILPHLPEDPTRRSQILEGWRIKARMVDLDVSGDGRVAGLQLPLPSFLRAAAGAGFMNDDPSWDSVVRATGLARTLDRFVIPSLTLAAIASYYRGEVELWLEEREGTLFESISDFAPRYFRVRRTVAPAHPSVDQFPCDKNGRVWVNFYGFRPGETDEKGAPVPVLETVSAAEILDVHLTGTSRTGRSRQEIGELLRGRICFVGVTARGLFDIRSTPLGYLRPGVENHATMTANLLNGEALQAREDETYFTWAMQFVLFVFLAWLMPRVRPNVALVAFLCLSVVSFLGCTWFLEFHSVILPWDLIAPLFLLFAVGMVYLNRFENADKQWIDQMFKRYVSPAYVELLKDRKGELDLTGRESEITPFFSDMASFSTISEAFSAEGLFRFLGEYLGEMADILDEYGGTLDKFEGDAVVAFFGAPIWTPDHAEKACLASLRMQARIAELEEEWRQTGRYPELFALQEKIGHWFPIRVRIGLNSGVCATGHLGTADRGNYTMMGDNVNLAARLESAGKQYGIQLTVSEDTYRLAEKVIVGREVDVIQVVGRTVPTTIYEVMGERGALPPETEEFLAMYEEAMGLYEARDWERAREAFAKALRRRPEDRPTEIFVERCRAFASEPPPEDWDGVHVLTEK